MGLFTRKGTATALPAVDGARPRKPKAFRIELGWRGMLSLILVCFCLFFWMFVLGIWAGQTILFPQRDSRMGTAIAPKQNPPARMAEQADPPR
jgi:hypothetical protein